MIACKFIGLFPGNGIAYEQLDHLPLVGEELNFEGIEYTVTRRKWFVSDNARSVHIWIKDILDNGSEG